MPTSPMPDDWQRALVIAALGTAALLASPATRWAGGWAAASLLTAFMPAHLHTFRVIPKEPVPMAVALVRLPLQVPLVLSALRVARSR